MAKHVLETCHKYFYWSFDSSNNLDTVWFRIIEPKIVLGNSLVSMCNNREYFMGVSGDTAYTQKKFAILSIWGMRISVYFSEGRYDWSLRKFGIRIEKDEPNDSAAVDESGYLHRKAFTFRVYNNADFEKEKGPEYNILSTASNGAEVSSNVTANVCFFNAKRWQDHEDPNQLLGETLRDAHRSSVRFFQDKNAAKLGNVFDQLLMQKTILVAYRSDTGSVVQDRGNHPMFLAVEVAEPEDKLKESVTLFRNGLADKGKQDDLDNVHRNKENELEVHMLSVSNILRNPLETLGIYFEGVKVADAIASEEVRKQANRASGEDYQLESNVKSAEAYSKSLGIRRTASEDTSEFLQALTAAEDSERVHAVGIGGGNKIAQAAATHAILSKNEGDRK